MSMLAHSLSSLRSALNNLYDPKALKASSLIKALGPAGMVDAPAHLRRALIQTIESLRPEAGVPSQSPAQRIYEVLHYRYVQQCSQDEVAEQLGLGVRQLKRVQRKALEVLAQRLSDQFGIVFDVSCERGGERRSGQDTESSPPAMDLQWLEEAPASEPVELGAVLPGVIELVQSIATRYNVRLRVAEKGVIPPLAVDAVALRQILLSLLCVAIRRAAGRKVLLTASPLHWHVRMEIQATSDQGSPEPTPEDGANLAAARQLVAASGGTLTLPAGAGAFTANLLLPAAEQVPVLVIDDNADTLRLLQRYAAYTRYRVFGARNAEQALSLAQKIPPQVVVLDIMMPKVDGWELLRTLRQHPLTRGVPVVACTILAQEELALSLGVNVFLHKPVSRQAFLAALDGQVPLPGP